MTEKYILVSDGEYCYTLNTQSEHYKTLEYFEKQEFENAKKDNVDINEYEDEILQLANDNYWDWIYNNHLEADDVNDIINELTDENKKLKQKIISLEDARYSYKQDWKQASADCELYKDEIKFLKDENKGLIEENEQLKQSNNEAIELILDGVIEIHDGKRDYAETIFNKAIKLLKGDV